MKFATRCWTKKLIDATFAIAKGGGAESVQPSVEKA